MSATLIKVTFSFEKIQLGGGGVGAAIEGQVDGEAAEGPLDGLHDEPLPLLHGCDQVRRP